MKIGEALNHILKENGIKKATLAARLGISPQILNSRIHVRNMTVDLASDTLAAINYRIVLLPDTVKVPKGGIIVTSKSEAEE